MRPGKRTLRLLFRFKALGLEDDDKKLLAERSVECSYILRVLPAMRLHATVRRRAFRRAGEEGSGGEKRGEEGRGNYLVCCACCVQCAVCAVRGVLCDVCCV